jgi:ComF family protein
MYCQAQPPNYHLARSVVRFDDHIASLIHALKYYDRTELAPAIAQLIHQNYKDIVSQADIICPIPLHPNRLKKRRYNQSLLIAKYLAKLSGKELKGGLLVRIRDIPSQSGLNRQQRFSNVYQAFQVTERCKHKLEGKNILIVDDVITTGATLDECACTLKKCKVEQIIGMSFARSY